LTRALAAGNADALREFYEAWFERMAAIARKKLGKADENACLDIVQESMLRVIRRCRVIESEEALQAWVGKVVQSAARDWMRKEYRRCARERARRQDDVEELKRDEADMRERMEWIEERLKALDSGTREMIFMRYRLGWTLERIGSAFGLTPSAVDGRVGRAVRAMSLEAQGTGKEGDHDRT